MQCVQWWKPQWAVQRDQGGKRNGGEHKGQSTLGSLVGLALNNGPGSNCAGKLLGVLSKGVIY